MGYGEGEDAESGCRDGCVDCLTAGGEGGAGCDDIVDEEDVETVELAWADYFVDVAGVEPTIECVESCLG